MLPLDGLVQGWMEALPMMRPGDEWILYVPPSLGYGPEGRPPVIPPSRAPATPNVMLLPKAYWGPPA